MMATHYAFIYEYDADGNVIYKGRCEFPDSVISQADMSRAIWYVSKYTYDESGNCTSKLTKKTSWALRAVGW